MLKYDNNCSSDEISIVERVFELQREKLILILILFMGAIIAFFKISIILSFLSTVAAFFAIRKELYKFSKDRFNFYKNQTIKEKFSKPTSYTHKTAELVIREIGFAESVAIQQRAQDFFYHIEQITKYLRKNYKKTSEKVPTIQNLEAIANVFSCDIRYSEEALPKGLHAGLLKETANSNLRSKIVTDRNIQENKFYIAHEIGHLIYNHTPIKLEDRFKSYLNCKLYLEGESEANAFAGALLLGHDEFKKDAHNCKYNVRKLMEDYNVSYETIAHRLAIIADIKFHFIKTKSDGKILKQFSRSGLRIDPNFRNKLKKEWAALNCFEQDDKKCCQSNTIDGEHYFCFSEALEDKGYSITLGCKEEDAKQYIWCYPIREEKKTGTWGDGKK